ncbi:PDZ domain-containing protein [Candidatus Uhrbacteria bacterium]|nr:PDZ domain-containing protein [Candidatus Uhrbacteria bacterium]
MKQTITFLLFSALCGSLAGAAAGFAASSFSIRTSQPVEWNQVASSTPPIHTTTTSSTLPSLSLIPVERRAIVPLLPPEFAKRGSSPSVALYRKPVGNLIDDRVLTQDKLLGQAVALTTDGWLVTTASAVQNVKLSEITVWRGGVSGSIEKGIIDHLSQTVFLKTTLRGLPAAAFARIQDLVPGAAMWVESDLETFEPQVVTGLMGRSTHTDMTSSEFASRRLLLNGPSRFAPGTPIWDPNGSLVALMETNTEGLIQAIPVVAVAASFNSLLLEGEIHHALLGVHAMDLSVSRIHGDRMALPSAGAYIRDDKKTSKLGIVKDSPAAKAKLKTGDVIVRVDRDILDGTADLGEVLSEYKPGSSVTLRVLRGTQDLDISLVLGNVVTSEILK